MQRHNVATIMSDTERQLVTRRRIDALNPIPGADRIEVARVDGWEVVVKRGEFVVGDPAIYFEIDSLLPAHDERFAFLRRDAVGDRIRLRTIRLRGQVSQGLLLPMLLFPELHDGDDLATQLNVTLWEPPISADLAGSVTGPIPSFIRKTDQERVQNLPTVIADSDGVMFEVTVKLDGTSMTIYHSAGMVGVCGRRFQFTHDNTNSLCSTARALALPEQLAQLGRNIAIQGELMGPKIQGNQERLSTHQFFVFDVWDIDKQRLMSAHERAEIVAGFGLQYVPVLHANFQIPRTWTVDDLLRFADGPSLAPTIAREGVVFKALDGAMSFKVISNAWLVEHG